MPTLVDTKFEALGAMGSLTFELSPPVLHELGLAPALRWLATDMAKRYQLHVNVDTHGPSDMLDQQVCVVLFRSVRELLINVAKHAKTNVANVPFTDDPEKGSRSTKSTGDAWLRHPGRRDHPVTHDRRGAGSAPGAAYPRRQSFSCNMGNKKDSG